MGDKGEFSIDMMTEVEFRWGFVGVSTMLPHSQDGKDPVYPYKDQSGFGGI